MMTLDERVRTGLHRSAESDRLDADVVFDDVRSTYERGLIRARILRQATTVAVVLTLIAGVGVFISWRAAPDRYRTAATVAITQSPSPWTSPAAKKTAAAAGLRQKTADPRQLALASNTRKNALRAAHATSDEPKIHFRATRTAPDRLALAFTSPSSTRSAVLMRQWVAALARVRNHDAVHEILANQHNLSLKVKQLHEELQRVDQQLLKLDPLVYHGVLVFDAPNGNLPGTGSVGPPPVPEQGSVAELNLAFRRIQILRTITTLGEQAAQFRFMQVEPPTTRLIGATPTTRVSTVPVATWAAISGWAVALLLVITGAVVLYRRRQALS